jgi:N-acetylglutamate synthase-like GNAT family acetyltransferase
VEIAAATAADMPAIAARAAEWRLDGERLEPEQFIVVRDGDRMLGFGRIKPYDGTVFELGTVGVAVEARGRGVGELIVRELIRRFPSDDVWITTDLTSYFERFGFVRVADVPLPLVAKLERICGSLRQGVVAMLLRRRAC